MEWKVEKSMLLSGLARQMHSPKAALVNFFNQLLPNFDLGFVYLKLENCKNEQNWGWRSRWGTDEWWRSSKLGRR